MKKNIVLGVGLIFSLLVVSCNSTDETAVEEADLEQGTEQADTHLRQDSIVMQAFADDKSTITINDIDPNDTTYSTRSKTLYSSVNTGRKLAVVYGYKKDDSPGLAIIQRDNEAALKLPQTKSTGINQAEYSNGTVRLVRDKTTVFLHDASDSEQYDEIR